MTSYIATAAAINVTVGGRLYTLANTNENEAAVAAFVAAGDEEGLLQFLKPGERIELATDGRFEMDRSKGKLYLAGDDRPIPNTLARRIIGHLNRGITVDPLVRFWRACRQNPEPKSVDMLWDFLEHNGLPVTGDGLFLAYRVVKLAPYYGEDENGHVQVKGLSLRKSLRDQENAPYVVTTTRIDPDTGERETTPPAISERMRLVDKYTGKVDNSVGLVVSMPRDQVVFDPNQVCAPGLHLAAPSYLPHYGGAGFDPDVAPPSWYEMTDGERMEYVREHARAPVTLNLCHPADVVSVPRDYHGAKLRTCRYYVAGLANGVADDFVAPPEWGDRYASYAAYVEAKLEEEREARIKAVR